MDIFNNIGKAIGSWFGGNKQDEEERRRRENAAAFKAVQQGKTLNDNSTGLLRQTSLPRNDTGDDNWAEAARRRREEEEAEAERKRQEEARRKAEEVKKKAQAEATQTRLQQLATQASKRVGLQNGDKGIVKPSFGSEVRDRQQKQRSEEYNQINAGVNVMRPEFQAQRKQDNLNNYLKSEVEKSPVKTITEANKAAEQYVRMAKQNGVAPSRENFSKVRSDYVMRAAKNNEAMENSRNGLGLIPVAGAANVLPTAIDQMSAIMGGDEKLNEYTELKRAMLGISPEQYAQMDEEKRKKVNGMAVGMDWANYLDALNLLPVAGKAGTSVKQAIKTGGREAAKQVAKSVAAQEAIGAAGGAVIGGGMSAGSQALLNDGQVDLGQVLQDAGQGSYYGLLGGAMDPLTFRQAANSAVNAVKNVKPSGIVEGIAPAIKNATRNAVDTVTNSPPLNRSGVVQDYNFENAISNPDRVRRPVYLGEQSKERVGEIQQAMDEVDRQRAELGQSPINRSNIRIENGKLYLYQDGAQDINRGRIVKDNMTPQDVRGVMRSATGKDASVFPNHRYPTNATVGVMESADGANVAHVSGRDGNMALKTVYPATHGDVFDAINQKSTSDGLLVPSSAGETDLAARSQISALRSADNASVANPAENVNGAEREVISVAGDGTQVVRETTPDGVSREFIYNPKTDEYQDIAGQAMAVKLSKDKDDLAEQINREARNEPTYTRKQERMIKQEIDDYIQENYRDLVQNVAYRGDLYGDTLSDLLNVKIKPSSLKTIYGKSWRELTPNSVIGTEKNGSNLGELSGVISGEWDGRGVNSISDEDALDLVIKAHDDRRQIRENSRELKDLYNNPEIRAEAIKRLEAGDTKFGTDWELFSGDKLPTRNEPLVTREDLMREVAGKPSGIVEGIEPVRLNSRGAPVAPSDISRADYARQAFDNSGNQVSVGSKNGVEFELGDYGRGTIERKTDVKNQPDRLSVQDVAETIPYLERPYKAGDTNIRQDNIAWVADMPNGEQRVIISRQNTNGKEEIINGFKINRTPNYESAELAQYGIPAQSRTGGFGLERLAGNPSYRDAENVASLSNPNHSQSVAKNTTDVKATGIVEGVVPSKGRINNVPLEGKNMLTKGNLYEMTKVGQRDFVGSDIRGHREHIKVGKNGKQFVSWERRDDNGKWWPETRAAYTWHTQKDAGDVVRNDEAIQKALLQAQRDGQIQDFVAVRNASDGGIEVQQISGDWTIDGGLVRNRDGAIVGDHVMATPFGVVQQLGGKFMVDEASDLAKYGNSGSKMNTFARNLEKSGGSAADYDRLVGSARRADAEYKTDLNARMGAYDEEAKAVLKAKPRGVSRKEFGDDIFHYIEDRFTYDNGTKTQMSGQEMFRNKYGRETADAVDRFKKYTGEVYDNVLDEVNAEYRRLGRDEVPKRKDYITHMQEEGFLDRFGISPEVAANLTGTMGDFATGNRGAIDASMVGLSENFKPNTKYNPFFQKRVGESSATDPFVAMETYLNKALYNKHMTAPTMQVRQFETALRASDTVASGGGSLKTLPTETQKAFADYGKAGPDFVNAVQEYANALAGKSTTWDRAALTTKGGRAMLGAMRKLQVITGQNKIVGNFSSVLSQTLNLPDTIRDNGVKNTLRGIAGTMFSKDMRNAMKKSDFLTARYTDTQGKFTTSKVQKATNAISKYGGMQAIEKAFVEFSWGSAYQKALSQGKKGWEAVRAADQTAARTVADRGIGQMPEAYRSTIGKTFLQFTYEVSESGKNTLSARPQDMAKYFVASFLVNQVFELATGREGVLPDVISPIVDTIADIANPDDDTKKDGTPLQNDLVQGIQRFAGTALNLNPGAAAAVNTLIPQQARKVILGNQSDFGRYGGNPAAGGIIATGITAVIDLADGKPKDAAEEVAFNLIPAGSQIRKTTQGLAEANDKGNKAEDVIRGGLFGKNAVGAKSGIVEGLVGGLGLDSGSEPGMTEQGDWYHYNTERANSNPNKLLRNDSIGTKYDRNIYNDWDEATKKYLSMTSDEVEDDRMNNNYDGQVNYWDRVLWADKENGLSEKNTEYQKHLTEYKRAVVNRELGADYDLQEMYRTTTLTEWRNMASNEPELFEALAKYDQALTEVEASRGKTESSNKYYGKKSSSRSGGGSSSKASKTGYEGLSLPSMPGMPDLKITTYNDAPKYRGIVTGIQPRKINTTAGVKALPRVAVR